VECVCVCVCGIIIQVHIHQRRWLLEPLLQKSAPQDFVYVRVCVCVCVHVCGEVGGGAGCMDLCVNTSPESMFMLITVDNFCKLCVWYVCAIPLHMHESRYTCRNHTTQMNKSWYTYEWENTWMSQDTWHDCTPPAPSPSLSHTHHTHTLPHSRTFTHTSHVHTHRRSTVWVCHVMWRSPVTNINESRHTHKWVTSHRYMSEVHEWVSSNSIVKSTNESRQTHSPRIWMSLVKLWVKSTNESRQTHISMWRDSLMWVTSSLIAHS